MDALSSAHVPISWWVDGVRPLDVLIDHELCIFSGKDVSLRFVKLRYSANTMDRSLTNAPRAKANADDESATVVIEIRRGGIPRSLSWTVDKLIRYDRRWTPYDVVLNGVSRGRLGPRGPRRMRAMVQPGHIAIELASIYSGLVYETAELDMEAGERVVFRYLPARSFFDIGKPSELRRVKNRFKLERRPIRPTR